jgi:hypothetical protein
VKAVLADALAGKALTANEWRMLAFYSWETDEQQLVPKAELPHAGAAGRSQPGGRCRDDQTRLWLKALAASDDGKGVKPDAALRERVLPRAGRPGAGARADGRADQRRRGHGAALDAEGSAGRAPLSAAFDAALRRLQADTTLSRGDRMGAVCPRANWRGWTLPKDAVQVKLPGPAAQGGARARGARRPRDHRRLRAPGRHHLRGLRAAGPRRPVGESDALLKANLAKSHSPYYLMSQLGATRASSARTDEALRWYAQAFEKSEGPATRLQWGSGYLAALVDLAPQDAARIEKTAAQLLAEAARRRRRLRGPQRAQRCSAWATS